MLCCCVGWHDWHGQEALDRRHIDDDTSLLAADTIAAILAHVLDSQLGAINGALKDFICG